jgi:hypothetical protein
MSRIALNGNASGTGTVTIASPNTNSDRTVTLPDETGTLILTGGALGTPSSGNGSNLTNLNASNLASGTVPTARLATGTANSTTYLRGDQTWATVSTTPTTAQVLSATAGLTLGDVGSYGFVRLAANNAGGAINPGTTVAGSNIRWAGGTLGSAPSGTWRWLGTGSTLDPCSGNRGSSPTVAERIS